MDGPVRFFLPEGGVSALDAPGQPFCDPEADAALFRALEQTVRADRQPPAHSRAAAHQRSRVRRRHWRARSVRCSDARPARAGEWRGDPWPRFERAALLKKFHAHGGQRGEPIVGGGAGTGLSAKCEEAGGIDLIVIYNSGRYRMAGRGSLAGLMAYGNANEIVDGDGRRGAAGGEAARRCWPASTAPIRSATWTCSSTS